MRLNSIGGWAGSVCAQRRHSKIERRFYASAAPADLMNDVDGKCDILKTALVQMDDITHIDDGFDVAWMRYPYKSWKLRRSSWQRAPWSNPALFSPQAGRLDRRNR